MLIAASRNNVWCASSNNATNFANVNNNGNPNNNNASNANVAAPGFCLTGIVMPARRVRSSKRKAERSTLTGRREQPSRSCC